MGALGEVRCGWHLEIPKQLVLAQSPFQIELGWTPFVPGLALVPSNFESLSVPSRHGLGLVLSMVLGVKFGQRGRRHGGLGIATSLLGGARSITDGLDGSCWQCAGALSRLLLRALAASQTVESKWDQLWVGLSLGLLSSLVVFAPRLPSVHLRGKDRGYGCEQWMGKGHDNENQRMVRAHPWEFVGVPAQACAIH